MQCATCCDGTKFGIISCLPCLEKATVRARMIPPTQNPRHGHQTRQNRCPSDPRTGNGSQAPQDGLNTPAQHLAGRAGALASAQANAQAEGAKAFEALVQQGLECRRTQALARKWAEAAQHMDSLTAGATGGMGAWDRLGGIFEGRVARALASLGMPSAFEIADLKHASPRWSARSRTHRAPRPPSRRHQRRLAARGAKGLASPRECAPNPTFLLFQSVLNHARPRSRSDSVSAPVGGHHRAGGGHPRAAGAGLAPPAPNPTGRTGRWHLRHPPDRPTSAGALGRASARGAANAPATAGQAR
jgi:hypothetical protein